jgi:hypothetical protein
VMFSSFLRNSDSRSGVMVAEARRMHSHDDNDSR